MPELRGTPVHRYLQDVRKVDLDRLRRQPGALRYRPDCRYYHVDQETGEVTEGEFPAMVALIQNLAGEPVGVHRTYLAQDPAGRWNKAPVPKAKLTLGPWAGGHISIWKGIGPRGGKPCALKDVPPGTHLYITEGIEDAMSVVDLIPEARVICAISLSNLGQVELPDAIDSITLVADRDSNEDARKALIRAIARHQDKGRTVRVFQNDWGGKDLNDALRAAREDEEARHERQRLRHLPDQQIR
ncbi:toprim domain-containing protein [Seohaeicola zhoushanensis]